MKTDRQIIHFLTLLRRLQKIDPEFPMQYAVCLAEIALDQGLSLTALANKTKMPLSTVSRIVGALSTHRQRGRPYNLVKVVISKTEKRRKELYLTQDGQTIIKDISAIMENETLPMAHRA